MTVDLGQVERPKCVVCGEEQTDLNFIKTEGFKMVVHVGFPVCDLHQLSDLPPDQYVFDQLIVEIE